MDRLKEALEALGLKCGGTLYQRADRLFSVKGKKPEEIDQKLKVHYTRVHNIFFLRVSPTKGVILCTMYHPRFRVFWSGRGWLILWISVRVLFLCQEGGQNSISSVAKVDKKRNGRDGARQCARQGRDCG